MAKSVLGNDPFQRGAAAPGVKPSSKRKGASPKKRSHAKPKGVPEVPGSEAAVTPEAQAAPSPQVASPAPEAAPAPPPAPETTALAVRPRAFDTGNGAFWAIRSIVSTALQSPAVKQAVAAASGSYRALMTGLGARGDAALDEYGQDASLLEQLEPMADFLYERYWRVRVDGADRLPAGPQLLVANHSGALPYDGPVLTFALHRERSDLKDARWLLEDQVFHAPFMGTLLNRIGAVRASPENALRLLAEGRPLIVFPEGIQGISKPVRERYQLKRLGRGGFAKIALKSRAPIIPVAVVGAEEATPLLAKLPGKFLGLPYLPVTPLGLIPLPSRWYLRFGDPIEVTDYPPEAADDAGVVQTLADQTRESIEGMLEAVLSERGGAFT